MVITNKEKVRRLLIHSPSGAFNAWLFAIYPHWGWAFFLAFIIYEVWQCIRLKDFGFYDFIGWPWGFGAMVMFLWLI